MCLENQKTWNEEKNWHPNGMMSFKKETSTPHFFSHESSLLNSQAIYAVLEINFH